ncbi:MAG: tape measure protein [Candidatus Symbiothrix sp.]|jgi:tape measure domain-containing protein|nr:tape measure protein [Candidatus Symbiothrix sp.]
MAANDEGKSYYGLGLDNSQLRADANRASNILKGIGDSAVSEGARIDNAYKKIAGAVGGYFTLSMAKSFISDIVKVRGEVESLSISFETLLGSKQKADALFGQIKEFAAKTPLELTPLAKGAQTLLSFNIEAEKVMPLLKQIGDISMGNQAKFDSLTLAFSQMSSTGKLMGQDLLQMINAGFNPLSVIAEKTGKSIGALKEEMSNGAISADMVADAFASAASEGGKFYGMLDKQSKGIEGSISNLHGAIDDMMNDLGTKGQGIITSTIAGATSIVEHYEEIGKAIADIVVAYGSYKAALITLNAIQNLNRKILMQAVLEKKLATAAGIQLSNAEAVAAARTKLLALAQQGLVKALQAVKAAMLSNPYTLIAVAVASLVFGIYKLVTAETAAEAAQRKHNEVMEAAREKKENLISKTQQLTNKINDETQTIYAQIKAWKELQKEMPEAFAGMTMQDFKNMKLEDRDKLINKTADDKEIAELNKDLETAQKRVESLKKSINEAVNMQSGQFGNGGMIFAFSRQLTEAEETLKLKKEEKAQRDEIIRQAEFEAKTDSEKLSILNEQLQKYKDQYAEIEKLVPESERLAGAMDKTVIPAITNVEKGLFDVNTEWGKFDWQTMSNISQLDFLKGKINEVGNTISAITTANSGGTTYAEAKENARKTYSEAKKLVDDITKNSKKYSQKAYEDAIENLDKTQKSYKALGGDTTKPKSPKITQNANQEKIAAAERIKKIEEYEKAIEKSIRDTELEIEQARIEAMEDGFGKQTAQIDLNYKKLITQNKQRREEMVKELNAKDEIVWQQENPKFKEKGLSYTNRMTDKDLSDEQLKQLESFTDLANTYQENANKEMLKNMLDEFVSYEQQITKTTKEYEDKRRQMHNEDGSLKTGFTTDNVDELNRNEENDLNAINQSFAEREATFQAWMDEVANMSLKQLEKVLKQAEDELAKFEASGEKDDKKLAIAKAKVTTAKKSVETENAKNSTSPNKRSIKEWQDLHKTLKDVNDSFEDIGDTVGGTAGEIIKTASNIASGTIAMIDGIKILAVGAGQAISTVEKASVILAIIGAAVQIITAIFNMASAAEARHQEALKEIQANKLAMQREYNLLLLEQNLLLKEAETIFGTDGYGKATNAIEVYKKALSDLSKEIKGVKPPEWMQSNIFTRNTYQKNLAEYEKGIQGLNSITVKTGHKKTGLFGWGKGKDIYSGILDVYPKLIDETGKFDAELAKVILNTQTMSDESKASLQNMIDLADMAEKAYQEVNDYLTDIFGELGNSMSDALTDAFRNGTDAAQAFSDSVSSMLEKLAQDMIYSITLAPIFEQAQKDMLKTMGNSNLTDEEKFKQYTQIMKGVVSDANAAKDTAFDLYKMFQDEAANQNLDLWKPNAEREASQKGFASMSQDSADELNGRFTAIQAHTYSITENTKILVANSNMILQHLAGIESNTKYCENLAEINTNIRQVKSGIDDMNLKGITIKK